MSDSENPPKSSSNGTQPTEGTSEEWEETSESYDGKKSLSDFSNSRETVCSSVNRLCLDFTRNDEDDTPAKIIKCEAFWRFVDTMPDLEKIKVAGRGQQGAGYTNEKELLESKREVKRSVHAKFPWIHMLMKYKKMHLDETALAGCKEQPAIDADDLLMSKKKSITTVEEAKEAFATIDVFEEDLGKRPHKTQSEAYRLIKQDPARKISEKHAQE